jgi:DNA repair exonuclease SbcCD ATPase subunit
MSPTEQFIGEIHVLEDAGEQIKRLHNGLWETSALSLERLRHSQELQQRVIEEAVAARKEAEAETERLEIALARESEERERLAREYDERLAAMESRIEKALIDRNDIEKIVEEAIAAQDRLEEDVLRVQNELDSQRAATERAVSKYNHERESREDLSMQLELAMNSLNEMRSAHGKEVIADLGATIERLHIENENLTEERDASQALSSDQSGIIAEQERLKRQFDHCQEEISTLHEENKKLTANLREYKVRFKKTEEQQKAFRIQFESENLALQSDLMNGNVVTWRLRTQEHVQPKSTSWMEAKTRFEQNPGAFVLVDNV